MLINMYINIYWNAHVNAYVNMDVNLNVNVNSEGRTGVGVPEARSHRSLGPILPPGIPGHHYWDPMVPWYH